MVFGVFDGLHEGHREFLREARSQGDWLIAVVTPDHLVHELKGYLPEEHHGDRMERLLQSGFADHVALGDMELGVWQVVRHHRPNIIALGYDQHGIRRELDPLIGGWGWDIEIRVMRPHKEAVHHSSLHRRKRSGF
jgi:cytidyltransferase-like protein